MSLLIDGENPTFFPMQTSKGEIQWIRPFLECLLKPIKVGKRGLKFLGMIFT